MSIEIYPSVAKVKRNGVFQNLPGFVQQSGDADIEAMIARKEINTNATFVHPKNSYFILNDVLYKATDDIPVNGAISVGDNCEVAILADNIDIPIDVSVKGSNLVPISNDGVGAYVKSGSNIVYYASYTTYHYVIISVKKNTRYFYNYKPEWWILADGDIAISGGRNGSGVQKRYIDTGNAEKLYLTFAANAWDIGVIVSEGLTGEQKNIQQTSLLKNLNQLMFDGWYACALPKVNIRFTVGIAEKFYYKNILSLPDVNAIYLSFAGLQTVYDDGVFISFGSSGTFNNYLFTVFDSNLSIVEQNVNGQFGQRYSDNVSDCSALIIGDSTVERNSGKIGQTLLDAFTERGKAITLLGTRGAGSNKNEGRSGWGADTYVNSSSYGGVVNPFYNPSTETFDFSYYMTEQGYSGVDFVIIQLGINDLYNVDLSNAKERIEQLVTDMFTIISSIKTYNANQKIILNLPTPCTADTSVLSALSQKLIRAKFIYYNSLMEVLHTNFSNTRCSHCHLILDPEEDIADAIHPTNTGLEKMAMEILSQINCFQN